ncbi:MAG: formate dehydrogenase accessory sulfurtransferase FdhD [Anaerolineaceae bacterium]|jgi:FdhD protein|nr:formate dehydrogenase accessory sulfurtransferase FdhD [Anaerolineaceae bacterium]
MESKTKIKPITFSNNSWKKSNHIPPDENSVILTVNGETWLSFSCSPFLQEELALGFLFNEHIIESISEVEIVKLCENNKNVDVWLNHIAKKPETWENTSGCTGGKTSMKNKKEKMVIDNFVIKPHKVLDLFSFLLSKQAVYKETRGVHCSLLSDGENLNLIAEDIGRHNTIDKLAGLFLRGEQKNWKQKIILTTGRVSSEMMQKSVRLGAAIVVSRTSPTSASVDFANEHNITLIGYTRRNEFTVYSNPHRIMN